MSSVYVILTTWPARITIHSSKHDRHRCNFHLPIACVNDVYVGIGLDPTLWMYSSTSWPSGVLVVDNRFF